MQDENLAKYKIVREIFHVIWVTFGDLERYQISFRQEQGRIFVSGFRLRQCGGEKGVLLFFGDHPLLAELNVQLINGSFPNASLDLEGIH